MILSEITSFKFEGIYFNIICHLLKNDSEIYRLTLENINKYCSLSKSFFNNEEQV